MPGTWHRNWQEKFPKYMTEFTVGKHIADLVTCTGKIVEFQNSGISSKDVKSREKNDLIWVLNKQVGYVRNLGRYLLLDRDMSNITSKFGKPVFIDNGKGILILILDYQLGIGWTHQEFIDYVMHNKAPNFSQPISENCVIYDLDSFNSLGDKQKLMVLQRLDSCLNYLHEINDYYSQKNKLEKEYIECMDIPQVEGFCNTCNSKRSLYKNYNKHLIDEHPELWKSSRNNPQNRKIKIKESIEAITLIINENKNKIYKMQKSIFTLEYKMPLTEKPKILISEERCN